MNRWNLSDEQKDKFVPIIENHISEVDKVGQYSKILELSDENINARQLIELLELLGYDEDDTITNGWQVDFWIKMMHDSKPNMVICGCAMTKTLQLVRNS